MAIYRQIHTTFWKDKRVGEWTQIQKLFFLYLLSNDNTTQCGVYEFNKRYAKFELDLSGKEVDELLKFFEDEKRIVYNPTTEELLMINWLKYNSARSPKVATVIDKELKEIKTTEFEQEIINKCKEYGYPIKTKEPKKDTVSIGYRYSIDTITQPASAYNQHKNQHITSTATAEEPEQGVHDDDETSGQGTGVSEDYENPATPATDSQPNMFQAYQSLFGHAFTQTQVQDMEKWAEDLSEEVVIEAMKRSALRAKDYYYSTGIMKNWAKKGVQSLADVEKDDDRFNASVGTNKNTSFQRQPVRKEELPNWAKDDYEQSQEQEDPEVLAEIERKRKEYLKGAK